MRRGRSGILAGRPPRRLADGSTGRWRPRGRAWPRRAVCCWRRCCRSGSESQDRQRGDFGLAEETAVPAVTLLTMTSTPQRLRRSIRRKAGDDRTYAAERTGDDLPGGVPRLLVQRSRRLPVRRTYDATVCATTWSRAGIAPVKSAAT